MVADNTRWAGALQQDVTSLLQDHADVKPDQLRDHHLARLKELYDRWSPLVFSFALDCLGEVAAAEEVTRRVFVEVWNAGPFPAVGSDGPSAWLIGLTRAAIADLDVAPRPSPSAARGKDLADSESKTSRLTELLISDEMSQQSPVREQVLRMALDEHLTSTQIAGRTQLTVDEVAHHLARALGALRDRLAVDHDAR